ncbi:MAG: type II toxin-antitoxin system RelE/ParE family toxin [Dehalococcoidia bacterium]|nr:type II toxin-antitoxin system RelE/ParE family toxin [Dehalococcoidia bacterium]
MVRQAHHERENTNCQQSLESALASEGHAGEALKGDFAGLFRLRVGDYRVIYARTNEGYLVLRIGHRREVYRQGRP